MKPFDPTETTAIESYVPAEKPAETETETETESKPAGKSKPRKPAAKRSAEKSAKPAGKSKTAKPAAKPEPRKLLGGYPSLDRFTLLFGLLNQADGVSPNEAATACGWSTPPVRHHKDAAAKFGGIVVKFNRDNGKRAWRFKSTVKNPKAELKAARAEALRRFAAATPKPAAKRSAKPAAKLPAADTISGQIVRAFGTKIAE